MGIILATAGSAVGLGNIWRFPYTVGQDGGAAFIILNIVCILLLGIPGMVCEFIVGRNAGTNAVRAYGRLSGIKAWRLVGYMGILSSTIILGFYSVVAGWCLHYLFASFFGRLNGDVTAISQYFSNFSSSLFTPIWFALGFIVITHLVVSKGVRGGIERVSKLLMPILFVLLLIIVVASCMLPGAIKGVEFLLKPDFSKVNADVFLDALGQAFFSLSLGTACLCTYASYFGRDINLFKSAGQIAFIDSMVAILAGLMIFPAAFSVGVDADSGPSLIFITLPNVFQQAFSGMPLVGYIISLAFYALLSLAALTSLISLHEVSTAFFHEELHIGRKKAALIVTLSCSVLGAFCSLSLGGYEVMSFLGKTLFDIFDFVTGQVFLPVCGFLTCLMVGWYLPHKLVRDEFTNWGTLRGSLFHVYLFAIKYLCPACILIIFLHQFGLI